jgi:hypothetical protein
MVMTAPMNTEQGHDTQAFHPQQVHLLQGALPIKAEALGPAEGLLQEQEIAADMEQELHGLGGGRNYAMVPWHGSRACCAFATSGEARPAADHRLAVHLRAQGMARTFPSPIFLIVFYYAGHQPVIGMQQSSRRNTSGKKAATAPNGTTIRCPANGRCMLIWPTEPAGQGRSRTFLARTIPA